MADDAQHPLRAARTTIAARNAHRAGAAITTGPASPTEQSTRTAVTAAAARDDGGTTVAAVAEPARRAAIAAGETTATVTDHAAVTATAGTAQAGTFVLGVGVAVAEQNARVRIVGSTRPDEDADEIGDRIRGHCRAR
jgi:hypothetical protein